MGIEERVGAHKERVHVALGEGFERCVDFGFGLGLPEMELHAPRARRFLHQSYDAPRGRTVWFDEQGNHAGLRDQLGKQLQPFRAQRIDKQADARQIAAGRAKLTTRPSAIGSVPTTKTIGIDEVEFFAPSGDDAAGCCD